MAKESLAAKTAGFLLKLGLKRDPKLGKLDFGILRVSLMVAALDGKMQSSEVETFRALAKKCRGYSAKSAEEALAAGMKSAGYLLFLAQTGTEKQLLDAFIDEAMFVMPSGFLNGSLEDVRRAFVTWTAMAIGDGEYSDVERKAIASLKKAWCDMKAELLDAETERWLSASPAFRTAYGVGNRPQKRIRLLADDFLDRVEAALVKYDEAALGEIVRNG